MTQPDKVIATKLMPMDHKSNYQTQRKNTAD
jgi:hypothetical protein